MEPSSAQRDLRLTLAGLQAGCLGSLLMIGWWMLGETLQRRSPWTIPNLLATTFYGERAYRPGFIVPTWVGLAGTLAAYCAAGILFALIGRERKGGKLLLLVGVATGLALNWLCFGILLASVNPLIRIYSPDRLITVSHVLYGIALATYPGFTRQLQMAPEPPPTPWITRVPPPVPSSELLPHPVEETESDQGSPDLRSNQDVSGGIP